MSRPPIIERAFQLARSGEYLSTTNLRAKLVSEGYGSADVDAHLSAPSLYRQLKTLCADARRAAGA